ncbi:MAG: alginate export porin, partial [Massilia sp.]|nr:alginate export porin [Massilia sp.]
GRRRWRCALAFAFGAALPLAAAEPPPAPQDLPVPAAPTFGATQSFGQRPAAAPIEGPMSSFQLPKAAEHIGRPPRPVTQFLTYQYSFGSESDIIYQRDRDLDARLRDNSLIPAPQINGYVLYRPFDELEMMLEVVLEREWAARQVDPVTLPDGEQQRAERRRSSLQVDQLWVRYKPRGWIELTLGRRNFEDDRHWLYDTSLDVAVVKLRHGDFNGEFSFGRKDAVNLDPLKPVKETRTDNYMAYVEYRGIEDIKVAGYAIKRDDRSGLEGKPRLMGLRAYGMPTDRFNFWTELAWLRGEDELKRRFSGHAVDAGATYRFPDLPLSPGLTLGYASGSGDRNRFDNKNTEFRQSGLESNELRLVGVSKFKYYGEALDPELSNLEILTAGLGFRLAPTFHVDLVYHKYRSNAFTDEIRNWALTAKMNQDPGRPPSNDVGTAFDVVLGFRNLFGVRRLGLDLRAGWFFPGKAFRNDDARNPANPAYRDADKGISVLAKFWY